VRNLLLAAIVLAACHATKPSRLVAPPPAPADAGVAAPDQRPAGDPAARAEAAWARRETDPAALDQAISLWEEAALRSADPAAPLLDAARARRARIARMERNREPDTAAIAADAQACAADAHRSWAAQFPTAAAQLDGKHSAAEVYAQIGAAGAEALYLEAVCGATWARMQGFTPLIERRSELTAALSQVAQLAPELDGAGAEREMGTLAAALPSYAGGDLAEARRHLEAAVQRAPQDSRNRLALARTVAVKAQDRALFEQQLTLVAKSDDAIAAADAAVLLSREEELFGTAEAAQPVPGGTQR
jgi:hypothetical protein